MLGPRLDYLSVNGRALFSPLRLLDIRHRLIGVGLLLLSFGVNGSCQAEGDGSMTTDLGPATRRMFKDLSPLVINLTNSIQQAQGKWVTDPISGKATYVLATSDIDDQGNEVFTFFLNKQKYFLRDDGSIFANGPVIPSLRLYRQFLDPDFKIMVDVYSYWGVDDKQKPIRRFSYQSVQYEIRDDDSIVPWSPHAAARTMPAASAPSKVSPVASAQMQSPFVPSKSLPIAVAPSKMLPPTP